VKVLAAEVMITDDGEDVHDNEQQQQRRRHPLGHCLEERHHEDLQSAHVVQDAEDTDDPQGTHDAQNVHRRGHRHLYERQDDCNPQDDKIKPVPANSPVALRLGVHLHTNRKPTIATRKRHIN